MVADPATEWERYSGLQQRRDNAIDSPPVTVLRQNCRSLLEEAGSDGVSRLGGSFGCVDRYS